MNYQINFEREQQLSAPHISQYKLWWCVACTAEMSLQMGFECIFFPAPFVATRFLMCVVAGIFTDYRVIQVNFSTFAFHVRSSIKVSFWGVVVISARWFIAFKWSAFCASPLSLWAKQPWNCLNNGVLNPILVCPLSVPVDHSIAFPVEIALSQSVLTSQFKLQAFTSQVIQVCKRLAEFLLYR